MPRSIWRSPGPSATSPSASGRSTSTGSIRTSASSSLSSWRSCSPDISAPASTCSTRSRDRERPWCRRSRAGSMRRESTSRPSTACSWTSRPVRTTRSCLEQELRAVHARVGETSGARPAAYVRRWFAPQAARELLGFRALIDEYEHADVLRVVLARAARSARRTTHFDLEFPREPQCEPYWCHKHRRECRPVETASQFLRRYTLDTLARLKEFSRVRARGRGASVIHGDMREERLPGRYDGVLTSPPYPGLIDYHEQHRYAYELLGLDDRRELEVGAAAAGNSRAALAAYSEGIVEVLLNAKSVLRRGAPDRDRRERPSRALPGDPRTGRAPSRRASASPCEPPHRKTRRRVLRRRADRALNRHRAVTDVRVASERARARGHLCPRRSRAAAGRGGSAHPGQQDAVADDRRARRSRVSGGEAASPQRDPLRGAGVA